MTTTLPVREMWRVAAEVKHTPAHRVVNPYLSEVTACGWSPPTAGVLLTRDQAANLRAMPCRCCLKGATR